MTSDHQLKNIIRKEKEGLEKRRAILSLPAEQAMNAILDSDQPAGLVQSFSEEDFYFLVQDIGPEEALPILSLAASKQWEYILDLEIWRKDRIDLKALSRWLGLLFGADKNRLVRWLLAEKAEFLEYYLFKHIHVRIREHDEDPSDFDDRYYTIDDIYYFRLLNEQENESPFQVEQALLEYLAGLDHLTYQAVLLESTSISPAEFEEESYRLRNVRLSEKGFVPFDDAISIYAPMTLEALRRHGRKVIPKGIFEEEPSLFLPPVFVTAKKEAGYFTDALAIIEQGEALQNIQLEFASLLNTLISADQEPVREREHLGKIIKKAVSYLSISLELLSGEKGENLTKGAALIQAYPLSHLFRLGYGRAMALRFRAVKWIQNSWFKSKGLPLSFWEERLTGVIGGLLVSRPLFFDNYETGVLYREFETLADIEKTEQCMEEIIILDKLLSLMTMDLALFPDPHLSYNRLMLTLFAASRAGIEPLRPLTPDEIKGFFAALWVAEGEASNGPGKIKEEAKTDFLSWLSGQTGLAPFEISDAMGKILEAMFQTLEDEYGRVPPQELEPRFVDLIYGTRS